MHELGSPNVETSYGKHCRLNARNGHGWIAVTAEIYYGKMLL